MNTINQNQFSRNLIQLNIAMVLISTSGVLGKYIDLPVVLTIGFRALIASVLLFAFCYFKKFNLKIEKEDRPKVILAGVLMGLHWVTYFNALRLSNVAIGMLSLFTFPAFTALLEPLILKTKILKFHLLLCFLVLLGIYFLVPEFTFGSDTLTAVASGVFSAICYALRNILMKDKVHRYNGSVMMSYQMLITSIILCPFMFVLDTSLVLDYFPYILTLALLTTAFGHTLFLYSLKHFSTVTVSIISCTQPIYGIIIGMIFLAEFPEPSTLIGGAVIVFTVIAESWRLQKVKKSV